MIQAEETLSQASAGHVKTLTLQPGSTFEQPLTQVQPYEAKRQKLPVFSIRVSLYVLIGCYEHDI